jgi:hypothetical protein
MHPGGAHRLLGLCAVCDAHGQHGIGRRRRGRETLLCDQHFEIWRELHKNQLRLWVNERLRRWRMRCA